MRVWLLSLLVATTTTVAGCATAGAVPRPYPGAEGSAPGSSAATSGDPGAFEIVERAESLLGSPYRAGGTEPAGFDCSGFVQYVFRQAGIVLPRSVREQWGAGVEVEPGEVQAGDLVFFAIDGRVITHVGIATGPDAFIHAPSERGVVRTERLSAGYWTARFAGARRVR